MNRPADDEVALAIRLTTMCRTLHCLPQPGGMLDQDWYHVALIEAGLYAMGRKAERDNREIQSKMEAAKAKAGRR